MSGACLDYDHYQNITNRSVGEMNNWMQESADYDDFVIPSLAEDLCRLKNGKSIQLPDGRTTIEPREYIFFETPLGREHKQSGQYIDVLIWLDIPLDVALARNIRAFTKIFMQNGETGNFSKDLHWLDTYLANYIEHIRPMLLLQYDKVASSADITLNADAGIDSVAAEAVLKLSSF